MSPVTAMIRELDRNPGHVRLQVFVGRNVGARGSCGALTLRTDEWDELRGDNAEHVTITFEIGERLWL